MYLSIVLRFHSASFLTLPELDTQRRRRSTFTAIDVAGLTMKTILQRNDTFSALMEYLESQSAPPYLRFWTNSDIYKQFALLALHEQRSVNAEDRAAVLDTMRTDAMYVFNAHFAAGAELPLYLSIDDDPHATGHDGEGRSIVGALLSEIQTNPNPNCFAACQAFVLRILERRFLAGFKESSMFAQTLRENNQAAAGGLSPLDLQRTMTEETATSVGGASSERGDNAAMEKSPAAVMSTDSDDDDDYEVDPAVYQAFSLGDDDQKGVDEAALPSMTSLAESSLHQSSTSSLVIGRDTAMDKAGHTDMALSYGDFDPVAPSISRNLPADADPVLHLAAEITRLREQLLHTTTQIEELRPHTAVETLNLDTQARMRKLNKQRRDTQRQISTLVGMAEELQADESRRASQESLGESGGTSSVGQRQLSGDLATVDLENVSIVVALPKDADERGESRPQTAASSTSTGSNTIMASIGQGLLAGGSMMAALAANANIPGVIPSLTNTVKNMTFDVVLTQTNSALPKSWTLPRSYHAFAMLHKELRLQYAKVDKIAFPSVRKPTREQSSKPREEAKRERLATLVRDMTGYLQLITGDRLLRESRPVVQFFHMDYNGGGSGGGSASKWSSSSSMQEDQWDMESVASSSVRTSLDSMASSLRTPRTPVSPADRPVASPTKPPPYPMRRRASRLSESFEAVATITPATATSTSSSNPNSNSRNLNVATVGDTQDEPEPAPPTMDLPSHFTEADLPLLIDTAFALLADLFDLHHPRHWLRRKALAVLRQFLLQAIATEDKSGKVYEGVMQAVRWWMDVWANPEGGREQSIVDGLKWFRDAYWPGGQWYSVVAAEAAATASPVIAEAGDSAAAKRTATRAKKSRDALISLVIDAPPPSETSPGGSGTSSSSINHTMTAQFYLHRIVGRQNAVQAMHRLWNMTQERRLNRVLVVGMLEVVFKLVFSEDRRKYD